MLRSDFPTEAGDRPLSIAELEDKFQDSGLRQHGFLYSLNSLLPLALLPSRYKAVFFFLNYFKLLKMIYELLYQAPNSFITCFLKESSKEQSVYC